MALQTRIFLARNDKIDAALAASAIDSATGSGEGFQYVASLNITPEDWHVAHSIGVARTAIALANGLNSSRHRRGKEDDERVDTEGALGEWLVATLLERSGSDLGVAAFVAHKAPKGEVDLVLEGKRIDVKTMGLKAGRNCNVNREQHFAKAPAAYLVVHLVRSDTADVADLYIVRAAEVESSWQLRQGWSPYFNAYLRKQLEGLPEPAEA